MNKWVCLLKLVLVATAVTVLMGCSQGDSERVKIARLQSFLQRERNQICAIDYRVMPPDVIAISSNYVREIGEIAQQIRPDGKISLPLLGDVYVAGLTPDEIRQEIQVAARQYYKKADVTVYVIQYNSQKIYVFGEVARPGTMPWTGSDTLLDVLAQTQPTLLAWPEKIKVIRSGRPRRGGYLPDEAMFEGCADNMVEITNENGAQELTIDLTAMVKSGDMSHNILLQPDDVIFVPPHPLAAVGLALQQVMFPLGQLRDVAGVPAGIDDDAVLHWQNRDRYYNFSDRKSN
jgi:polysaccharide biosynthesis/export protein